MIASSTSAPMAIVSPPMVIVFKVTPNARSARTAATSENGMAAREMNVARTFIRNTSRMIATSTPPSRRAAVTFSIATEMKSACRKMCRSTFRPFGNVGSSSSSAASSRRVSSSVLASGCFITARMTAGWPLALPSPRLSRGPIFTSASWPTVSGWPSRTATTVLATSSVSRARPTARSRYSCPPST